MKEQEIKYKIAKAIAERQLTKQGINDSTDAVYKIFEEQLTLTDVSPKSELLLDLVEQMKLASYAVPMTEEKHNELTEKIKSINWG